MHLAYLHIQRNAVDGACAIVEVYCQVIQAYLLFEKLPQVMLEQIAAGPLLQELGNGKERPWHPGPAREGEARETN
jgi:hypothetical protein